MAYTSKNIVKASGVGHLAIADKGTKIIGANWENFAVSLRGSFKITQEQGEKKETFIDQSDSPYAVTHKAGKVSISWKLPNTSKKLWEMFLKTVSVTGETVAASEEILGVKLKYKPVDKMLRVILPEGDKQTFYFPNLDWGAFYTFEGDDPASFNVEATVIAEIDDSKPDFIVVTAMDGQP